MIRIATRAVALATALLSAPTLANDFDVAHIREQGQNMIIIPLDRQFGYKGREDQSRAAYALQVCASSASLAGDVVVVWPTSGGIESLGPRQWAPFLRSIDMTWVAKNINKSLHCR